LNTRIVLFGDVAIANPRIALSADEKEFAQMAHQHKESEAYPAWQWSSAHRIFTRASPPITYYQAFETARRSQVPQPRARNTGHRFHPHGLRLLAFVEPRVAKPDALPTAWLFKDPQQHYFPVLTGSEASGSYLVDRTRYKEQDGVDRTSLFSAIIQQLPEYKHWSAYAAGCKRWRLGDHLAEFPSLSANHTEEITAARQRTLDFLVMEAPRHPGWADQCIHGWRRLVRPASTSTQSIMFLGTSGNEDVPP
jgi:hypothetical protein